MRLRKAAGERRSSDRRNNNVSWISEVKEICNVAVRKKRGRRAPRSAKRLHEKNAAKVIDTDDAVDDDNDDTDESPFGPSQSVLQTEKATDVRTAEPDLSKKDRSGDSSDGPSSALEDLSANSKDIIEKDTSQITEKVPGNRMRSRRGKFHLKKEEVNSEPSDQNDLCAVKKGTDVERSSREIKDDEVSDVQQSMTSSKDKSSEEVEDVNVCDICGDVGDEDSLAVCSRCHDGAEHIYCMQVRMEEVPNGEWLCEDCETEVKFEKNKLEKCEVVVDTSKRQSSGGKISGPLEAAKGTSSDSESESENVGCKELDIANEGNDVRNKWMEADAAVTSSVSETVPEPGNIGADSRKRMPVSRESSLKFDRDKGKQASQVATSLASSSLKNQPPQARGPLSKSVSFNNSKVPKVKQLNEVPQKPKLLKECWSSEIKKEGPVSMTTKSATFKKPKPCEPMNKAKPSALSAAEGPRIENPLVSQNVTTDRRASILGCPSSTAPVVLSILSRTEATAENLASGHKMDSSINLSAASGLGGKNFHGNSELKKPLSAEGSTGILGSGAQRKIIQSSDTLHRDNNVKDPHGFRPGVSNNRNIRCQRCNEVGHSTQFCAADKLCLSATKPLGERNLKETCNKWDATSGTSTMVATMPNYQRDESCQGFSLGYEQIAATVPEQDYIWQGDFELWRTGRSPELCDGFQAHLSCSASQKVLDVAKKFPSKVQLEELPRENSWPTQFQQNCPTYKNVGLFFFARDVQSYENQYIRLVENMLKNDLVLRGNFDTVELLIFPSSILSKNVQRWNMFYFLWGVFRVSTKDRSKLPPDVPECANESKLNGDPLIVGPSASVQSSGHSFSNDVNNFSKSDPNLVKSATCADSERLPCLKGNPQFCRANSLNQHVSGTNLDNSHDSSTASSTDKNGAIDHSATTTEEYHQKLNYSEHQDEMRVAINGDVGERDFDVNMVPVPDDCSVPSVCHEESVKECQTINLNDAEGLMDIDHANTDEVNTGALASFSHALGGARKRDFEMVNGAEEVDGSFECNKKMKLDSVVSASSDMCEVTSDGVLSNKVHPLSASSVDDGTGNKPIASLDGKCVFPLDLNTMDDTVHEDIVNIPSSDDEDFGRAGVQGLDKEIGVDRPSEKASLPSPLEEVGEKRNFDDSLRTDITGSLSLSLGFLSKKEQ